MSSKMDKIFSPIKGRILEYLDNVNISKEKFYHITGITASNFKGKGAESELGGDKIVKILSIFSDISPEWLILGEGSMLKSKKDHQANPVTTSELPPGPCRECALREKLIARQEQTIELLTDKISDLQLQLANNDTNHGNGHSYKQTG